MAAEFSQKIVAGSVTIDYTEHDIAEDARTYRLWAVRNRLTALGLSPRRVRRLLPKCVPHGFTLMMRLKLRGPFFPIYMPPRPSWWRRVFLRAGR